MKIRTGFVSNSSSSSFCIYGVYVDNLTRVAKENLEDSAHKLALYTSYGPDGYEGLFIGMSWASIQDNQTGGEFKKEIETKINILLGKPTECSTHEEGWNNQ